MVRKILDILPPEKPKERRRVLLPKKEKIVPTEPPTFSLEPVFYKKKFTILFFAFILIGVFSYFALPKAEIEIRPELDILTFETELVVNKNATTVDFSSQIIPGKPFEAEKNIVDEFLSSGRILKEKKAEGLIRIFNNYNSSQPLIANTRFQPPLEKFQPPLDKEKGENPWFRLTERVNVPSKSHKDVKVVADAPGEKYNIGPSVFSVPGLAGLPQYTFIYGESFQPMSGGFKKEIAQVTQEDLDNAKEIVEERAMAESQIALQNNISSEFILTKAMIKTEIVEASSSVLDKAEVEKFISQAKANSRALAFKEKDLEDFVIQFISLQIPNNKKIHQESLKIDYIPENIDLESGKAILSLTIKAKIYSDIDKNTLKKSLKGKTFSETKFLLENYPEITQTSIKFWPFWVKKVPQNEDKIRIELNLD